MKTLGVIGIGAFGEFMLPHLAPHFQTIKIYDQMRDLTSLVLPPHVQIGSLQDVCSCEILILCVPIQSIKPWQKTSLLCFAAVSWSWICVP